MEDPRDEQGDDLIARCLEALQQGNLEAVEIACSQHPDRREDIRSAVSAFLALREAASHSPMPPDRTDSERVGRFEIVRELGRGGTGIVFLARDTSLDRLVALKILAPYVTATDETLARFDREVRALARVRHPHTALIHEVGRTDDGIPFFVMDYIDGETLESRLRRLSQGDGKRLTESDLFSDGTSPGNGHRLGSFADTVAHLAAQVADALEHAHGVGVIHRDVKPGNILIDTNGEPRLVDFGIARVADTATITRSRFGPGTPAYMSPEQVSPDKTTVGPRTDIYSLGATLYHCLGLRPPFEGETTEQIFEQIRRREPMRLARLNPSIPRDLEAIVRKAMAKEPLERYATAAAFRDDLLSFLAGRRVLARRGESGLRARRWARRNPVTALSIGLVLVALVAIFGGSVSSQPRSGSVTFDSTPSECRLYLFRYLPYDQLRPGSVARLVPVPCGPDGRPQETSSEGFVPGDPCLVITDVQPHGAAARVGLRPGDLIQRLGAHDLGDGVFVRSLDPAGDAARRGVQAFARIVEVAGSPIRNIYDWETIPDSPVDPKGFRVLQIVFENTDGSSKTVDIRVQRKDEPQEGAQSLVVLTRRGLRDWGLEDQDVHDPVLEDILGVVVADPAELLTERFTGPAELACLRSGKRLPLKLASGEALGIRAERTAYPLVKSDDNERPGDVFLKLEAGSYLALQEAGGCESLRYPFVVEADGARTERPCLLPVGSTPEGFLYVHGGLFLYQGDPDVTFAEPLQNLQEDEYFISRFEVSMREWFEFVNDPDVRDRIEAFNFRFLPRVGSRAWNVERRGKEWLLPTKTSADSPVVGIGPDDVKEYIEWRNRKSQEEWTASDGKDNARWTFSLPSMRQWEKAGRGVDGRQYAWGSERRLELCYSYTARSHGGGSVVFLEPRGRFIADESPYGVRDLTGSAAEWNEGVVSKFAGWDPLRGGSWSTTEPSFFSLSSKAGSTSRIPDTGFRLVARRGLDAK